MTNPVEDWKDIRRQVGEGILREPEDEGGQDHPSSVPPRSVLEKLRSPMELAFAMIIGVLCGLGAVLGVLLLRILFG